MRILFISHYFDPEPVVCGLAFPKELVKLGHEVEVLTGFPHYPGGKLYPGYKIKFFQKEIMDGIPVLRVPVYPSHDRSSIRRFLTYTSFGLSAAVIGPWVVRDADVAFVYHPPPTVWLPAWVIRLLHKTPFVYNVQDFWPDALASSTMVKSKLGLRFVDKCCRFIYKSADRIVAQSPGFKEELCKRGVQRDKIDIIYNWCDDSAIKPTEYDPALAKELGMAGKFNVLFAGGMGKGQALSAVLDAAVILKDELQQVQFVFIGSGVEEDLLKDKVKNLNLKNVIFLKRRPKSEIGAVLSLADVLLVHLKDNLIHEITIPSKIQAYMNVKKPILIGAKGDATDLVMMAGAGLKCEPENPESIARAIRKLFAMPREELSAMGENGRKYYEGKLSLQVGAKRFVDVFNKVIHDTK